jgi:hypothetical protein
MPQLSFLQWPRSIAATRHEQDKYHALRENSPSQGTFTDAWLVSACRMASQIMSPACKVFFGEKARMSVR